MRKGFCLFAMVSFLVLAVAKLGAVSLPVIELDEDSNEVLISVVNRRGVDLKSLTVAVDKESLPQWAEVSKCSQGIDVPPNAKGREKLVLKIQITHPPQGAFFQLPLTLMDSAGNCWHFEALVQVAPRLPETYGLSQNYPNPFNPTTTIRYSLAGKEPTQTELSIFNILGQRVRTLVDEPQSAGYYSVEWDGKDESGQKVASGTYFYRLVSGGFVEVRKMLLVE